MNRIRYLYMLSGNDISKWQGDINYDVFKHNSNFVIMKSSEGTGFIDPKFSRNQSNARAAGMLLGYYHFARPDLGNSPVAEADWFIKVIGKIQTGEVLCLDFEPPFFIAAPLITVSWCKSFLDRVFELTGVKPLIYLNKSQVKQFNWSLVSDAGSGLWLACYDNNIITGSWPFMAMQQWTSSQTVPGVQGKVDGDRFFGSAEQFKQYGYNAPPVSSSSPSSSNSASSSSTDSPSMSASVSPSASESPSGSPSSSASPSYSTSPSPSPSPSPSAEIPGSCEDTLAQVKQIVFSEWAWFGSTSWKSNLKLLRSILG